MAKVTSKCVVGYAKVFAPKDEGWSESVNLTLDKSIPGYVLNKETNKKEASDVKTISVFSGELIKALSVNPSISAFLSAKTHDEKLVLLPMLLSGAKIEVEREHDAKNSQYITTIGKIVVTGTMLARVERALDAAFGF